VDKILCIRNSKLGDFIITFPSLQLIKKKNPNCKIYYLSSKNKLTPNLPNKIENNKIVDSFIYYQHNLFGIINLIFQLRNYEFNKIYYLNENSYFLRNFRNYLFFLLIRTKKRFGFFNRNKDYKKFNESLQLAQRVEKKFNYLDYAKLNKLSYSFSSPIIKKEYLTISVGGFSSVKNWPLKNWYILTDLLLANVKLKIVILGTNEDIILANNLIKKNRKRIISYCGKTSLGQLFNLIKFSKLHITNDNGSMHVASLYKKKSICLFNNHDPHGKWFPINNESIIIRPKNGIDKINPYKVFKNIIKIF
jgi:ADP-heptose:LPS heptosyltransferase